MKAYLFTFFILCACNLLLGQSVVTVIVTKANLSEKLKSYKLAALTDTLSADAAVTIDENRQYQRIIGFGGTYNEATAYNLKRLGKEKRDEVLNAFFNPSTGAGWSIVRTTINSCDGSSEYYSYDETAGDTLLKHFSIKKDIDNYMIPGLQQALKIPGVSFKIFASPWTPPVWMKSSKEYNKGFLLPEYYNSWALYFSKYLKAYKKNGINIWAVTPQNEPKAYQQAWDACGWTAAEMNVFIKNHLGPTLKSNQLKHVKVLAWDHNKNQMLPWMDTLMSDPVTATYIDGIAYHWYEDGEGKMFEPVLNSFLKYPNKPLIASEQGVFGLHLLDGSTAELYATDIIGNMNNGSSAWVMWGMAYDVEGKPNHAGNYVHSPVMINMDTKEITYNPSYYYLLHFSKFVKPGYTRIASTVNADGIFSAAFTNGYNKIVLVMLNKTDTDKTVKVNCKGKNYQLKMPGHSIATVLL